MRRASAFAETSFWPHLHNYSAPRREPPQPGWHNEVACCRIRREVLNSSTCSKVVADQKGITGCARFEPRTFRRTELAPTASNTKLPTGEGLLPKAIS